MGLSLSWPRLLPSSPAVAAAVTAVGLLLAFPQADARSRQEPRVALPTQFSQCPQFFADGLPPLVPHGTALRELCYEAFAVLHSGSTRTPVYVAQRLNRRLVLDADEKRAIRCIFWNASIVKAVAVDSCRSRQPRVNEEDFANHEAGVLAQVQQQVL